MLCTRHLEKGVDRQLKNSEADDHEKSSVVQKLFNPEFGLVWQDPVTEEILLDFIERHRYVKPDHHMMPPPKMH